MSGLKKDLTLFTGLILISLVSTLFFFNETRGEPGSWRIVNSQCVGCGGCAVNCIRPESAASAVMESSLCAQRFDCPAFFRKGVPAEEVPENQLCPTGAISRIKVRDSLWSYSVDPSKCIGCGKCTSRCQKKCDGALSLVVDLKKCVDCNECQIALKCPKEAVQREGVIQ